MSEHWYPTHQVGCHIIVYIREDKKKWAIGYKDGLGFISDHWRSECSAIQAAKDKTPVTCLTVDNFR